MTHELHLIVECYQSACRFFMASHIFGCLKRNYETLRNSNRVLTSLYALLIIFPGVFSIVHNSVNTWSGVLQYDEDWGYVDIRENAHTFWWLYSVKPANNRPLFLWLQGGPSVSGSGFGNFQEIGPKTLNENDNVATWLQTADLVFVDSPVGTGFSYVDDNSALNTNVHENAQDLLVWLRKFIDLHPEYRSRSFYIFCENYGGKVGTELTKLITQAIGESSFELHFRALVLGGSWISPIDYVTSWGPYLYANSFIDNHQFTLLQEITSYCQTYVTEGKWTGATNCLANTETIVEAETGDVSWFNIRKQSYQDPWSINSDDKFDTIKNLYNRFVAPLNRNNLMIYMNSVVREKLGVIPDNISFGGQAQDVFTAQYNDFMVPVYKTVDLLLKNGVNVIVYNGNQDLLCNTLGTNAWVQRLNWSESTEFDKSTKHAFKTPSSRLAGFYKSHKNFQYWWHIGAGQMVPHDTPETAMYMISFITKRLS